MGDHAGPRSPRSFSDVHGVPDEVPLDHRFSTGGLYALRSAVAAHASDLGAPDRQVESLVIVASELATNAILHGGGRGRLRLWRTDGRIAMRVSDYGRGLADPAVVGMTPQSPAATGGRGLWITRHLCDQVEIVTGSTGTAVTVSVLVEPSPDDY
jgi:anti-sigma regulatory factor (Ser/Thr protein kinase)